MNRTYLLILVTFAAVYLAGCNTESTATVNGNVTLNGQPLADGTISFSAVDTQGGSGGGDIVGGKYEVKDLKLGKYQVHVAGAHTGGFIMPGDPRTKQKMTDAEIRAMSDPIPPDVTGNDQSIELKAGPQAHDFKLESKSKL